MLTMNFESIPDEILLEIFEYMSGCDLIRSFHNLNRRLNAIIHGFYLHIDLSNIQQNQFLFACQIVIPHFKRQIRTIKLSNKQTIDGIRLFIEQTNSMKEQLPLQTLVLIEPMLDELNELISRFSSLISLYIKSTDQLVIPINLLSQSLRICRIPNCQIDVITPQISQNYYLMQELTLNMANMTNLLIVLRSMINLKRLTCSITEHQSPIDDIDTNKSSILFTSLIYLKLTISSLSFKNIENLIKSCPCLEHFVYTYTTGITASFDDEHIDIHRWKDLFSIHFPAIKHFDLHISLSLDPQRDIIEIANQFQTLVFLTEHRIRIIHEITNYKHILCTIPFAQSHLNIHTRDYSISNIPNAYTRIRHLDLILNETMLIQQQHRLKCPLVHSFYLGFYKTIVPIDEQSRLLDQSISFVYLKHFELYGTCIPGGFLAQLLNQMINLNSLALPLSQLIACQNNLSIRTTTKRIKKLQLTLKESLSASCIIDILVPIFPNLHWILFAIDNRIQSIDVLLSTMLVNLKDLVFLEIFAMDGDWSPTVLTQLETNVRYRHKYHSLYVWM